MMPLSLPFPPYPSPGAQNKQVDKFVIPAAYESKNSELGAAVRTRLPSWHRGHARVLCSRRVNCLPSHLYLM